MNKPKHPNVYAPIASMRGQNVFAVFATIRRALMAGGLSEAEATAEVDCIRDTAASYDDVFLQARRLVNVV